MCQLSPALVNHLLMNVNIIHCHGEAEVVTWIVMFLDVFRFCFEKAELYMPLSSLCLQ